MFWTNIWGTMLAKMSCTCDNHQKSWVCSRDFDQFTYICIVILQSLTTTENKAEKTETVKGRPWLKWTLQPKTKHFNWNIKPNWYDTDSNPTWWETITPPRAPWLNNIHPRIQRDRTCADLRGCSSPASIIQRTERITWSLWITWQHSIWLPVDLLFQMIAQVWLWTFP